jgi:hypothetical protein
MALKQWLIEKELAKSIAEGDLLCNTPPRALSKFKEQVWSTLESQLKDSLERGYPHFEISFSSEEVSGEVVQILVLEILDSALSSEDIGYSISSKETKRIRGERQGPEPYNYVKVCGTVTI